MKYMNIFIQLVIPPRPRSCHSRAGGNPVWIFTAVLAVLVLAFGAASCGVNSGSVAQGGTGAVAFQVKWVIPTQSASPSLSQTQPGYAASIDCAALGVSTVMAAVTDSSAKVLAVGGPFNCTAGSGDISGVPAGSGYTVVFQGISSGNEVKYQGTKTNIAVAAGQVTNAGAIVAAPVTTTVPQLGMSSVGTSAITIILATNTAGTGVGTGTGTGASSGTGTGASTGTGTGIAIACPANTTGTYPDCTAIACPAGQTGTYPNCTAIACPANMTGTYPNCVAATYSISGDATTSGYTALAGVTMTLSGASSTSTTTDANGIYTFTGLANGTYTVMPTKSGYTFTPASSTITISNGNNGVSFTATANACPSGQTGTYPNCVTTTYSMSGNVVLNEGSPAGVTMTLIGASSTSTTTDASGNYMFTGLANGTYTVTPTKSGYTFNPASSTITISNGNNGVSFTATANACPSGQTGTYPNCVAMTCPVNTTGTYPNCVAIACPANTTGTYPNCVAMTCPANTTGTYPNCVAIACPANTTGTYPNCVAMTCPANTTGTYPNCVAMTCPANTTGTYPNCTAIACPAGYTGTYPNCVAPVAVPSMPTAVSVTAGNARATVSWAAVTGATSYNVYYRNNPGVSSANGTRVTGAISGGAINGLANGVTYYFIVMAVNSGGESPPSTEVSATPDYYTNNGNGTITSSITGLMWQQQDDGVARDWATATNYCAGLSLGGYSGWRLPTLNNLLGIVDSWKTPSINATYFPATQMWYYWTSTSYTGLLVAGTTKYDTVLFQNGSSSASLTTDANYVRCVRP